MQSQMFEEQARQPAIQGPFFGYCDGACKGNGKAGPSPGGWGFSLRDAAGTVVAEQSGGEPDTTNNRMEMVACLRVLEAVPPGSAITVYIDSQYTLKGLTEWVKGWERNGWRTASKAPVANVELWKPLVAAYRARKVTMQWVRGHNGDPGNERADALANEGCAAVRRR